MITPNLEWPHNSEITAQTTAENYILIPKSLLVGEVLYLKHVFVSWAAMILTSVLLPLLCCRPLYVHACQPHSQTLGGLPRAWVQG